ncbi:hypothetical protein HYV82_03995 [Candidatus Woesearchaeota archaeon]|nr:hypothetical protein [Candidatus Woesearchaeota archaeon]
MLVSNTSTLVLLAKTGCLEQFIYMAPTIVIPAEVKKEALFQKGSYYARLISKLIDDRRIIIVVANKNVVKSIMAEFNLDEGEAATYAVFNEKRHNAIMTDDGELIKLCKLERVPFICAMAVVIRLFEKRLLSRAEALDKLYELYKVGRYSEKLYEYFKSEVK